MRNGSLIGQFVHNQSRSVYKSCTFASPGHNCSQPLEHCKKKQLTKEAHSVSETGLAKLNKQFLLELYGHSKRRSKSPPKLWMFKHITSLQKRFNIRTSLQVTLLVLRRGFIKGEILRLLRTNSVKETFELRKLEFLARLLERGYPRELTENILGEVKFSSRN